MRSRKQNKLIIAAIAGSIFIGSFFISSIKQEKSPQEIYYQFLLYKDVNIKGRTYLMTDNNGIERSYKYGSTMSDYWKIAVKSDVCYKLSSYGVRYFEWQDFKKIYSVISIENNDICKGN